MNKNNKEELPIHELQESSSIYRATAEEGLTQAEEEMPDIILMDIRLPGVDGYTALKLLRNRDKTRNIPVIAVSANAMKVDIERGKEAGFDDYLTKPIDINHLYKVINAQSVRQDS